jgi:outer membrane murein-binding lipoprotein Lpp
VKRLEHELEAVRDQVAEDVRDLAARVAAVEKAQRG